MPLRFSIDLRADVTGPDLDDLQAMRAAVYPPETRTAWGGEGIEWAAPTHCARCWDGDALVAHVGLLTRAGAYDGRPVTLGGVGGVMVHPDHRHRGLASATLRQISPWMAAQGVDFAVLVCREALFALYGGVGWRPFEGALRVRQPGQVGPVPFTFNRPMTLAVGAEAPTTGDLDLCGPPW